MHESHLLLLFLLLVSLVSCQVVGPYAAVMTTLAGDGQITYNGENGQASLASFNTPRGVAHDKARNLLYIADVNNHRIRRINMTTGVISKIAGAGGTGNTGDDGPAFVATLNQPTGLDLDATKNVLYFVDVGNFRVRAIDLNSGNISAFAGSGTQGYGGDNNLATHSSVQFDFVIYSSVTVDPVNNLVYIADSSNSRIRVVNRTSNIITTFAGIGSNGFGGDGGLPTSSLLFNPANVAVDSQNNLVYIADTVNNRIRVVNRATNVIKTFAGLGNQGYSGDGVVASSATFAQPSGVMLDTRLNALFVIDRLNHAIRIISRDTNIVSTFAGNGEAKYLDNGIASKLSMNNPSFGAVDSVGQKIYFSDTGNSRIRVLSYTCNQGYFGANGNTSCSACISGTFASSFGSMQCSNCISGTFSTIVGAVSSNSCSPCSAGLFSVQGSASCTPCAAASFSSISGASNCTLCPSGTFSTITGSNSISQCLPCAQGTANSNNGATFCPFCGVGTFSNVMSATSCTSCAPGSIAPSVGSTSCQVCSQGTYNSNFGASTCQLCPSGSFSSMVNSTTSANCQLCAAGNFSSNQGSSQCQVCAPGSFSTLGANACQFCGIGTFASLNGSASCSQCAPGFYSDVIGATTCKPCSNGTFTSTTGSSICTACALGTAAASNGSSSCTQCQPGYFGNVLGASSCQPCGFGSFSSVTGASSCTPCSTGTVANGTGFTSCTQCQPGEYNDVLGAATCTCTMGTFASAASTACNQCLPGFYSSMDGAASCQPCSFGSYSALPGATQCLPCENGKLCTTASKSPVQISLAQSLAVGSDPYFVKQKDVSKDISSELIRVIFIVVWIVALLLVVVIGSGCISIVHCASKGKSTILRQLVAALDVFARRHFTKDNEPVMNRATFLGGFLTILLAVSMITILALSIVDVARDSNKFETATVVPKEVVNITAIQGEYSLSLLLHNFADLNCNPVASIIGFSGNYTQNNTLFANGTCAIVLYCQNCSLDGSSQSATYSFPVPFAVTSAIEYTFTVPHFDPNVPKYTISERIVPTSKALLFRGPEPTRISYSLTATLYQQIDGFDYFVYNLLTRLLQVLQLNKESIGYSVTRNAPILGSTVDEASFFSSSGLSISFSFLSNPNAYYIRQVGKVTIMDFFSRIFSMSALVLTVLALIMVQIERLLDYNRSRKVAKPVQINMAEATNSGF